MSFPDPRFMRQALTLARRGQGEVEPNPMVGCVIVRDGQVLAKGWHKKYGGPHAEVEALRAAQKQGVDVRGAQVYVTLEPCCHFGKTPPCTQALLAAGVGAVAAAQVDPFPAVANQGLEQLRQAGVAVHVGLEEQAARRLNAPYLKRVTTELPWVMLKWAQTLDGHPATRSGQSRWISGAEARRWVHEQRARVDALMVGIGTVLADDPSLTAREVPLHRLARRVVIDAQLRLPLTAKLLSDLPEAGEPARGGHPAGPGLTLAVHQAVVAARSSKLIALEQRGVEIIGLPPLAGADPAAPLDLRPLLQHLARAHQATNVLVEGGPRLMGSLLEQRLVDQLFAFIAPKLLADAQAPAAFSGAVVPQLDQAWGLTLDQVTRLGDDVLLEYRPAYTDSAE